MMFVVPDPPEMLASSTLQKQLTDFYTHFQTGYKKGEVQKRKIVETEMFSVDERIKIISQIVAIMGKQDEESM
jgi:hypothetical protein